MAKKTTSGITHETIVRDVRSGKIAPVYYLMGEESYYIDRVSDFIVSTLLKPEDRDFNLITFFEGDQERVKGETVRAIDFETVVQAAMGFPMGAERLVVLVKEAQNMKRIEVLETYLKQPQYSTVLIICHKHGVLDRRKAVAKLLEKVGVLFESAKLGDYQMPAWINAYLQRKQVGIEPAATEMLAEFVGSDINRMAGELEKLIISLPSAERVVKTDLVAQHIGVSKEFNIFELTDALGRKDVAKANQITNYFDSNQKQNPIQKTLPALFRYFSNLMLAYYAPDKSPRGIASWLGVQEWQVKRNVLPAMQLYTGRKVMSIIEQIRRTDARSKGVGNPFITSGELMKELIFFILH